MASSSNWVGGCHFCIGEPDHDIDESGHKKGKARPTMGSPHHQTQGSIDIRPDISIAPHVGTPDRNISAEFQLSPMDGLIVSVSISTSKKKPGEDPLAFYLFP